MNENEAIERINRLNDALNEQRFDASENSEALQTAIKALEEVQQYRAIGTPEECRAAIEKQTAKEPIYKFLDGEFAQKKCLSCGNIIMPFDGKYCSTCGQKLEE